MFVLTIAAKMAHHLWCRLIFTVLTVGSSVAVNPSVTYDGRSFIIDGARELLLSGGMHYNRVPRADWDGVMKMAKELGKSYIHAIAQYASG
jgi:hypothetical protein